ncbi:hypothetical protein SAMN04489716_1844 [Actinoplanes derwentensis]|uniref:Uncharacterized protein n=2 Tax=Actinoplanes derwentensis TaxID=113562 RepID=A0A1H1VSQ0_9ACTN|nr:hypothetical protein Ade03nite_25430 [Actinoplanes derwentensis]SDS87059.1 hypothetical protein SAMN04489716_1844 [Actinoplanes derwentensis]
MRRYGEYRGRIAYGVALLGVPALVAAAGLWSGGLRAATPSSDPATMWLAAANGRLVRANALVAEGPAQIVDSLSFPAADGMRLLPVPGGVVVSAADGTVTRLNARDRVAVTAPAGDGVVAADGERLYRVPANDLVVLDAGTLAPAATHRLGRVTGWATAPGALFVAADGDLTRVDATGATRVRGLGATAPLLAGTSDGVAGFNSDNGEIFLVRGTEPTVAATISSGPADAFAAAPDGRGFALLRGRELIVVSGGDQFRQVLTFDPGPPAVDGDLVHLPDPAAGTVHRFVIGGGLREEKPLEFGAPGRLDVDVHRSGSFLWLDDVGGRIAWAVHDGQARRIVKSAAPAATSNPPPSPSVTPLRSSPPPPSPTSTTTPPPAASEPARSPRPSTTGSRSTSRSPSPSPSRSPKPSPSPSGTEDPLEDCDGELTALFVDDQDSTGKRPRITVTICEEASGTDEYWIVSHSQDDWFAKTEIDGAGTYPVRLLNGSGEPGEPRDFAIVAGRTQGGRDWLRDNLTADKNGENGFPRHALHDGVEIISNTFSTTS